MKEDSSGQFGRKPNSATKQTNTNKTFQDKSDVVLDKANATWSRFMNTAAVGQNSAQTTQDKNPFELSRSMGQSGGFGYSSIIQGERDFRFSLKGTPGGTSRPMPLPYDIISQFR